VQRHHLEAALMAAVGLQHFIHFWPTTLGFLVFGRGLVWVDSLVLGTEEMTRERHSIWADCSAIVVRLELLGTKPDLNRTKVISANGISRKGERNCCDLSARALGHTRTSAESWFDSQHLPQKKCPVECLCSKLMRPYARTHVCSCCHLPTLQRVESAAAGRRPTRSSLLLPPTCGPGRLRWSATSWRLS
jgi:hypothetical protein